MSTITRESLEALEAAVDMVDLVGGRTPLRRSGARYVGRCPFHDERTPSFSVNGQDKLGTKQRPEPAEGVVLVRDGAFYGWPRCWPSYTKKRLAGRCRGVTAPVAYLEPHSSADGIAFWRGDLFVALWGQYLSNRHGRKLVRVELKADGSAKRTTTFARGFDHPLALVVDPRGGLLVADWGRGVIYRIQSTGR